MPHGPGSRLDSTPTSAVRSAAAAAGAVFLVLALPMQVWERRMRATGGPGIVGLQLAPDPQAAATILATWARPGRRAARHQTVADFAYLTSYAYAGVCGGELLRRRTVAGSVWDRSGRVVRWLPALAATADAAENVLLLRTLAAADRGSTPAAPTVRVTRTAAITKFGLLAGSIGWAVGAAVIGSRSNRGR